MPSCLILGDSLAVGVSQHLPQCEVHAKVGAQTNSFIGSGIHVNQWFSDTALVSLGSNDSGSPAIQYDVLRKFRKTLTANRVFWILQLEQRMVKHNNPIVITDVRFPNVHGYKMPSFTILSHPVN